MKKYLGDSVYADVDGDEITLTTENGFPDDPRNRIVVTAEMLVECLKLVQGDGR